MKKILSMALALVTAAMMLPCRSQAAVNYDRLLDALERLEATLRSARATRPAAPTHWPAIADADGNVVTLPQPVANGEDDELLEQLSSVVTELRGVTEQSKQAESERPKFPVGASHGKLNFYGAVHGAYYQRDGSAKSSSFDLRTVQLGINGNLNTWAHYWFIGEFSKSPYLLDAKITLAPTKSLSFEVGQYKPPFCTDALRATTAMPFVTASLAKSLGPSRDVGAAVSVQKSLDTKNALKLTGGLYNGAPMNTAEANRDKNFMARAEWKWQSYLVLAANVLAGKTNAVDSLKQNLDAFGGSLTWNWQRTTVEGEYILSQVGSIKKAGWYLWTGQSFRLKSKFVPEIQVLARYDWLDANTELSGDRSERLTIGTNLYIDGKFTKLQLNYQINTEETVKINNNEWLANLQVAF